MFKTLLGCALISFSVLAVEVTPTTRVTQSMSFADDLNFANLELAINRQLKSYDTTGLVGQIKFGTKIYPKTVLRESLALLQELTSKTKTCLETEAQEFCYAAFNSKVNANFAIYKPVPASKEPGFRSVETTKFTSYYSPDLTGSRTPTDRFKHAIYRKPDLHQHQNYTRVEIDYKGVLAGKGYDIFYVEDSYYDLYLLHVQGGGRIKIHNPDGTEEMKYLSYDGKNSRSFQMIYKYMLQKGYLTTDTSVPAQRRFLEENPDKEEEIFSSSPSYVYFKESEEEPVGLNNIPLTENRSLAIDNTIYKTMGLINFVKTVRATHLGEDGRPVKRPFARFFISQDTGGAIRGNARCDLYMGYGQAAELAAYSMNEQGEQYFLVKK